jgi:hypothetical protein
MEWGTRMRFGLPAVVASLACAVCSATLSFAPAKGISGVSAAAAVERLNIIDAAMTLTPTAADYANDYIEITGASGLRVELGTSSNTGCVLFVRCADAAPRIALADFLVRTLTAPGSGGTSTTSYTAVTASGQALWSTGVKEPGWTQINIDIRIKNLFGYTDPIGGGTSAYTNNLTFTVVAQ